MAGRCPFRFGRRRARANHRRVDSAHLSPPLTQEQSGLLAELGRPVVSRLENDRRTSTPASRSRAASAANKSAEYHSSPWPRPSSAVRVRASAAPSSSGGTSPPSAMTPLTGRGRRAGGAKGHGDALGESREDQGVRDAPLLRDLVDDGGDERSVVGDGQLAILSRHPARHDVARTPTIEPVQALHRDEEPALRAGNRAEPLQLGFRGLRVSVEADEQRRRVCSVGRLDEIAAVRRGGNRPLDHQITGRFVASACVARSEMSGRSVRRPGAPG